MDGAKDSDDKDGPLVAQGGPLHHLKETIEEWATNGRVPRAKKRDFDAAFEIADALGVKQEELLSPNLSASAREAKEEAIQELINDLTPARKRLQIERDRPIVDARRKHYQQSKGTQAHCSESVLENMPLMAWGERLAAPTKRRVTRISGSIGIRGKPGRPKKPKP